MKIGSGLLAQLERCGLSAKLADEHREIGEDKSGMRDTRTEIARAFGANDQAQLPEANAALVWLMAEPGEVVSVGEPLDLIDPETGEVLSSGKPGAVLANPCTVVAWYAADQFDAPEPEDDLGLLSMGLAACKGQPFRVATVGLDDQEVFPRRSPIIEPDQQPSLLARIKAAASRPRIACPGDWCGSCRQSVYCEAWLARAKVALVVFTEEMQIGAGVEPPVLDLTNETASGLAVRIKDVEAATKLAKEQLKSFVRHGGLCVVDGKEYYPGSRDGRESVDVAALRADGLTKYIKTGEPYEQFGWRKVRPAR